MNYVDNPKRTEDSLVCEFSRLFICVKGREYFCGELEKMLMVFDRIVRNNECHNDVVFPDIAKWYPLILTIPIFLTLFVI